MATLRIEGPGAVAAVQAGFQARSGRPLAEYPSGQIVVGRFGGLDGRPGEEVVVCRRGEDVVELHCHGGLAAVAAIEETLVAAGCRPMTWREWVPTGPDEPIAAAAMVALAEARTQRTAAILLDQYHGALRRAMAEIQQAIDSGDVGSARRQSELLLSRAKLGQRLTRPWSVVLAGRSNVGKSSLMNALAGHQRAIVHPTPGTTRDAVTALTAIDGWPVELCDTAGLARPTIRSSGRASSAPKADSPRPIWSCWSATPACRGRWKMRRCWMTFLSRPNKMTTVCHCFAEAVPIAVRCPALLASKQWHSAFWSTTRAICQSPRAAGRKGC